mgnify:CR=1 FL=1
MSAHPSLAGAVARAVRNGLVVALLMAAGAVVLIHLLKPLIAATTVNETVTATLGNLLILFLPFMAFIASGAGARSLAGARPGSAIAAALVAVGIVFVVVSAGQHLARVGPFAEVASLQATLGEAAEGVLVEAVDPGGVAEQAGLQPGDIITTVRRDPVDRSALLTRVAQSAPGDPLRLRVLRAGEEMQLTVPVGVAAVTDPVALLVGLGLALVVGVVAVFWPAGLTPYVLLVLLLSPLFLGYAWLLIASFSYRTQGLLPIDASGNVGGFTLDNWRFLSEPIGSNPSIWVVTVNTLAVALVMTVLILAVSSMAGYALSRMSFAGRRTFLSFTLILHGFPAVTLLISIFFVLNFIGKLPAVGGLFGYNTLGGIALVMVAFDLPLGVWLMKGFFDNISWDMERSALIDGASRWRTFWEVMLPQIRPGLLALGIFAFISGWSAYLIPRTYSVGTRSVTLAVFLNQLTGDVAPVNWNQVAAVGLFQLIPVLVFFVFAQEYLLNIYAGGTKGTS